MRRPLFFWLHAIVSIAAKHNPKKKRTSDEAPLTNRGAMKRAAAAPSRARGSELKSCGSAKSCTIKREKYRYPG
jgi:hypothetical protein